MALVFTWKHKPGATCSTDMRVREARFGDGYSQVVKDGLNNAVQTWTITFEGDSAFITPIRNFLEDHGGATSFLWTPPIGDQRLFRSKRVSITSIGAGVYSLTTDLTESFTP